jgi:hypothetical protein
VRASEGMLVAASRSPADRLKPLSPHGVVGIINRLPQRAATSERFRRFQVGLRTSHPSASIVLSIRGPIDPAEAKVRGTWPVTRRSTMETLIFAFALTVIAILVLADATVAATEPSGGRPQ